MRLLPTTRFNHILESKKKGENGKKWDRKDCWKLKEVLKQQPI
jgi:hypothetical protein